MSSDDSVNCEFETATSKSEQTISSYDSTDCEIQTESEQRKSSDDCKISNDIINLIHHVGFLLNCVDHESAEACSISLVQEQLRKSNVEAYMPQVVSIGPIHKGRTCLLYMEEIKLRCVTHLFTRAENNAIQCLRLCSAAVWAMDHVVRAAYVDAIKLNEKDLAKIIVIDGCFLLELLISASPKLEEKLKRKGSKDSPGLGVVKRNEILSDLVLLENQIPLLVLDTLIQRLFPERADDDTTRLIQESALSIFGYSAELSPPGLRASHFVQLVHAFTDIDKVKDVDSPDVKSHEDMDKVKDDDRRDVESQAVGNKVKDEDESPDVKSSKKKKQDANGKSKYCATRLEAAGVTIEQSSSSATEGEPRSKELNGFDLKIKFRGGKLEIPQLYITKTTEAKWRNLIAWELNRTSLEKHHAMEEAEKTKCRFICYAWFIQSLVCCVHDVELLRDKNVLEVQEVKSGKGMKKLMSNEDLLNLFDKLTEGVSDAEVKMDPWFVEEIQKLNAHPKTVIRTRWERVMWHFLRRCVTWIWRCFRRLYRSLKRTYIPNGWTLIAVLAAAAGLLLTGIQTYYSIHP